jgi:hypothetical protein
MAAGFGTNRMPGGKTAPTNAIAPRRRVKRWPVQEMNFAAITVLRGLLENTSVGFRNVGDVGI